MTIREIAQLAGVSPTAVSFALRGKDGVSEATRAHILEVVKAHGYRPNPLVAALMSQTSSRRRSRTEAIVGVLTTHRMDELSTVHDSRQLAMRGLKAAGERAGFLVEEFLVKPGHPHVELGRMLYARGVRGLILNEMREAFEGLVLPKEDFAYVSLGLHVRGRQVHSVGNDHAHSVRLCLENLSRLGYRRIGLAIDGCQPENTEDDIVGSMLSFQFRTGAHVVAPLVGKRWSASRFLEWMRKEQPDAVVCSDHRALEWLRASGADVPGKIGFAHLHLDNRWEHIAGINQDSRYVAEAAMGQLVASLSANEFGYPRHPRTVSIQGHWVDGGTATQVGD